MRIDFRCLTRAVAERDLDVAQVCAVLKQVGGEGVLGRMRKNLIFALQH